MIDTVTIRSTDDQMLLAVKAVIEKGGLVAFPTDTVYGLACDAFNPQAIQKLYQAKRRTKDKALPVLIASANDLDRVATNVTQRVLAICSAFWPGPLTIVMEKHPSLPGELSSEPTIGIRIPAHPVALEILDVCGPLAVSSANVSGGLDSRTAQEVLEQLSGRVQLVVDGGPSLGNTPSTVVDVTRILVRILREGPIGLEQILRAQDAAE